MPKKKKTKCQERSMPVATCIRSVLRINHKATYPEILLAVQLQCTRRVQPRYIRATYLREQFDAKAAHSCKIVETVKKACAANELLHACDGSVETALLLLDCLAAERGQ